jgi:hypothetical protein
LNQFDLLFIHLETYDLVKVKQKWQRKMGKIGEKRIPIEKVCKRRIRKIEWQKNVQSEKRREFQSFRVATTRKKISYSLLKCFPMLPKKN